MTVVATCKFSLEGVDASDLKVGFGWEIFLRQDAAFGLGSLGIFTINSSFRNVDIWRFLVLTGGAPACAEIKQLSPTNLAKWYTWWLSNQSWIKATEGKILLTPWHTHWMPSQNLVLVGRWNWWKPAKADCQFYLTHTTKQYSRGSSLAQTGFAAFGKEMQLLISGSPTYAETKQLPRQTSSSGILATSWW